MKKLLLFFVLSLSFLGISFADFEITYGDSPSNININEEKQDSKTNKASNQKAYLSIEKKDPKLIRLVDNSVISQDKYNQKLKEDEEIYSKYEKELGEDYYVLYRIVEKIIRANNLYYQNWRVALVKATDDFNAFSSQGNLIAVHSALYDTFFDNEDAMAFVLAHEIGHLILKHQRASNINRAKISEYDELRKTSQNTMGRSSINDIIFGVAAISSEVAMRNEYKKLRKLEFDADKEGIILMARAGYNPRGAFETMDFISNMTGVVTPFDEHPDEKKRSQEISEVINSIDLNRLKSDGQRNLYNSQVLKIKQSSDKKTLVITKAFETSGVSYSSNNSNHHEIERAYSYYLNNDMTSAIGCFEKAYEQDPTNYISALYLSYAYEYLYKTGNDRNNLDKAQSWIKKAEKLNATSIDVMEQKRDISNMLKKEN